MRRSTKIIIGVIVFILISLIIGLTLYFVLSKKSNSSRSSQQSSIGIPTYTPQQELSNFLKTMKENLTAFTNNQTDLHRFHKNMMEQTDKKFQQQMMQQLIIYYKSSWSGIKKFSSSLYQPIDTLLMNTNVFNQQYQQKFLKGYVALNNKINRYDRNINNEIKRGKDENIVHVLDTSIGHLISDINFFLTMMQ
jgi:hypothetical protein